MSIKILLADDQCLMLEGIKTVLQHEPGIEVVGTARDGQSAIAQVKKLQPDIVLIDIEMPKMNGITATKYICRYLPLTKVIVLTSHDNEEYLSQALQAGAAGYLLKSSLLKDLKQAIHNLGQGCSHVESRVITPDSNKILSRNIIRYHEKIAYVKKYRKSIYKPAPRHETPLCLAHKTRRNRSAHYGVTRSNLAPIFDTANYSEFPAPVRATKNLPTYRSPRLNRQRYFSKITWLLLAIASLILSIIIF